MRPTRSVAAYVAMYALICEDGCWLWQGNIALNGYGVFSHGSRAGGRKRQTVYAHRAAYVLLRGDVPVGLELDHLCRVRRCVNPSHLEPVTRRENVLRGLAPSVIRQVNAKKTACPRGHAYDGVNINGARICRTCARMVRTRKHPAELRSTAD